MADPFFAAGELLLGVVRTEPPEMTTESDAAGQPLPKAGRSLTVALGMTVPLEMLIFPAGAW